MERMADQAKRVLVSGASFAGLATAYWMRRRGYEVTVVETAKALRTGGTAVNIEGPTVEVAARMGILDAIRANRLNLERWEYKNADDVTEGFFVRTQPGEPPPENDIEVERDVLLTLLFDLVKDDVEFVFDDSITSLRETSDGMAVAFRKAAPRDFALVFGCDGLHSVVRKLWFGAESEYVHFLEQYFAITIVDKSLIVPNTGQMFNVPGKCVMLNAYKTKTDIVLCFVSEKEIAYDYRNEAEQRKLVEQQFDGLGWRTKELLSELRASTNFYFDKLCQVRMPAWTKGRVALVGDAGYCASPAAGKGGSLALDGAAALADAFERHPTSVAQAFADYDASFRPYLEQVQADAVRFGLEGICPRTEEAIRKRNTMEHNPFEGGA